MAVPIRSHPYHDRMHAKRQARAWVWRSIKGGLCLGLVGAAIWGASRLHIRLPHGVAAIVPQIERQPVGTWCRPSGCQFFDRSGVRWGTALQSSGPLLLLVQDQRASESAGVETALGILTAIHALPQLGLTAKEVTLTDAEPGAAIVLAAGYSVYIDPLGDVADQMGTLALFLSDRAKDPAFAPAYIDLRTPGRVYYR